MLDALVEEATVDANGEDEQVIGLYTAVGTQLVRLWPVIASSRVRLVVPADTMRCGSACRGVGTSMNERGAWPPARPPATGVSTKIAQTTNSEGKPQSGRRPLVVYWQ